MNQLIALSPSMTMGTREIADMLGKRHDHIKSSAEKLAACGAILTPVPREFEHRGNTYTEYLLNKLWLRRTAHNSQQHWLSDGMSWSKAQQSQKSRRPTPKHCLRLDALRLSWSSHSSNWHWQRQRPMFSTR